MIERPLMTPDELKSLPKGTFIVTKIGFYPIKVKLKLFFKWGIEFEKTPYEVPLRDNSTIKYACKDRLTEAIKAKYCCVLERRWSHGKSHQRSVAWKHRTARGQPDELKRDEGAHGVYSKV